MSDSSPSAWQLWKTRLRWGGIGLISCVFIILLVQNWETIELKLLTTTLSMPRAVIFTAFGLLGFVLGLIWSRTRR